MHVLRKIARALLVLVVFFINEGASDFIYTTTTRPLASGYITSFLLRSRILSHAQQLALSGFFELKKIIFFNFCFKEKKIREIFLSIHFFRILIPCVEERNKKCVRESERAKSVFSTKFCWQFSHNTFNAALAKLYVID